jgi:hypothetical protein
LDLKLKGDAIPESDHFSRLCLKKTINEGEVQAAAFLPRRATEESISINWLEALGLSDRNSEIDELWRIYSRKFNKLKGAQIALLNVGQLREVVLNNSSDKRNLAVLHDPILSENPALNDPSHSGIYNLKPDDIEIAEIILQTILENHHFEVWGQT